MHNYFGILVFVLFAFSTKHDDSGCALTFRESPIQPSLKPADSSTLDTMMNGKPTANSSLPSLHAHDDENTFVSEKARQTAVFLQSACLQHQYIRSRDLSAVVERPERLRAVTIGVAAAIARLEETASDSSEENNSLVAGRTKEEDREEGGLDPDALAGALGRMKLERDKDGGPSSSFKLLPVTLIQSHATVDLNNHAAVKYVHGDIDGDVYIEKLMSWARESWEKVQGGGSEIPQHLSQGDLYREFNAVHAGFTRERLTILFLVISVLVCPESITAIQGALGTVCEAVDKVMFSSRSSEGGETNSSDGLSINRAFVAIRPPGHHCGEDTPCGFCFMNNVAVAAAHGKARSIFLQPETSHSCPVSSLEARYNSCGHF